MLTIIFFQTRQSKKNVTQGIREVPKNKTIHQILSNKSSIKTSLKSFIPSHLRSSLLQTIKKLNTQTLDKNITLPISLEFKETLKQSYRDDILLLQDLIDKDLSHWL